MSTAKTTLIGANQFFINAGSSLFQYLTLPTGLDKTTLTDNILMVGGEFETLYSDPIFLKNMIGIWSAREQDTFKRWVDALAIDYAPLENYDRQETWTDVLDSDGTSRTTGSVDTDTTNGETVTNDVSAYDSTGYQPHDKSVSSATGSIDTDTSESSTSTLDNTNTHNGRIHGNIGVTSSQELLSAELELGYWNIYSRITEMFIKEFCIMIYS